MDKLILQFEKFCDSIFELTGFNTEKPENLAKIKEALFDKMSDGILETTIDSMSQKDMDEYNSLVNEGMDEMDALMEVAKNMPGLKRDLDILFGNMFEDMVFDAITINKSLIN